MRGKRLATLRKLVAARARAEEARLASASALVAATEVRLAAARRALVEVLLGENAIANPTAAECYCALSRLQLDAQQAALDARAIEKGRRIDALREALRTEIALDRILSARAGRGE